MEHPPFYLVVKFHTDISSPVNQLMFHSFVNFLDAQGMEFAMRLPDESYIFESTGVGPLKIKNLVHDWAVKHFETFPMEYHVSEDPHFHEDGDDIGKDDQNEKAATMLTLAVEEVLDRLESLREDSPEVYIIIDNAMHILAHQIRQKEPSETRVKNAIKSISEGISKINFKSRHDVLQESFQFLQDVKEHKDHVFALKESSPQVFEALVQAMGEIEKNLNRLGHS